MKRFIEGDERSQITLLPECLDDYIVDDNPVRVVDENEGIAAMVPMPLTSGGKFNGRFDKRDFVYDSKRDVYLCPAR